MKRLNEAAKAKDDVEMTNSTVAEPSKVYYNNMIIKIRNIMEK